MGTGTARDGDSQGWGQPPPPPPRAQNKKGKLRQRGGRPGRLGGRRVALGLGAVLGEGQHQLLGHVGQHREGGFHNEVDEACGGEGTRRPWGGDTAATGTRPGWGQAGDAHRSATGPPALKCGRRAARRAAPARPPCPPGKAKRGRCVPKGLSPCPQGRGDPTCLKNSSISALVQRLCTAHCLVGWLISAACSSSDSTLDLSILRRGPRC